MKLKLSLIGLALIATIGFASAQNTTVKTKEAKVEKSCCTESAQKATLDKKDAKTCKCEGVKDANGKAVQNKECTGACDKKDAKSASCCDKKDVKSASCCDKEDVKSASCCDKKVEKKAACCEGAKAAEVKPATENCSECEKNVTAPAKSTTAPVKTIKK